MKYLIVILTLLFVWSCGPRKEAETIEKVPVFGWLGGPGDATDKEIKTRFTELSERGIDGLMYNGGHDPEDYTHKVGDPPTELSLHKNSPGYRLILNNILFPAAKKKKLKT